MSNSEKKVDRDASTDKDTSAKPGGAAADSSRQDHMTEDGKSLEAGSGNSLGDGMTAGGADRVQERRKLQD